MASLEELRIARIKKIELLKQASMDPYTAQSFRTHTIKETIEGFELLSESKKEITLVGRIISLRGQGALIFFNINDGTEIFQALLKKGEIKDELFNLFLNTIDIADFIEIKGSLFKTKTEQKTLLVNSWRILTKALQPLPEKWHGLQDSEERFRKRYLDILTTEDLKNIFIKKEKFWAVTRDFMKSHGFLEVETPTLEITTGGAEANPFKTYHKDFDLDVFLRISVGELWQKRLMAAGFPKTFEIGRVFRNEGSSSEHLQEFTNMEFYWSYADYKDGMKLAEMLYKKIAEEVFGTLIFETRNHKFDLSGEWPIIDFKEEVFRQTEIDVIKSDEKQMINKLDELGIKYEGRSRERLIDTLWKYCRRNISGPAFLIHHPKIVSPLAKSCQDNIELTERFQIIIAGSEVGNGFSELNDPIDQRLRFVEQQKLIEKGDKEAMAPEWDFVEMLEHGMPPTCGFGFGERLFSFMINKPIRETQLFPLMKPRE